MLLQYAAKPVYFPVKMSIMPYEVIYMWVYVAMVIVLGVFIWNLERKQYQFNKSVGNIGESIVAKQLYQLGEEFDIENNINIGNSQIDHLVINHELQICFVIETKYWSGTITGNRNDTYWLQEKKGQEIKYLYNPIKQNIKHCSKVRKYYIDYHIYGIVVFVRNKNVPRLKCIVDEKGVRDYINKSSNKFRDIPV
jgi:hypothetical protein